MKKLFYTLTKTDDNYASIVLRISFGIMMLAHGAGKMFGVFGGFGFANTTQHMTENMGIPYILAVIAILVEVFSAIAIMVGFHTRINALLLAIVMAVASTFHFQYGFFMNWFGKQAGEGFEFHLLAAGMMIALAILGGGKYSIDKKLNKEKQTKER